MKIPAFSFSLILAAFGLLAEMASAADPVESSPEEQAEIRRDLPTSVQEARGRARWMHETIHGALQVMHRDFFGDDDTLTLPSQSLEDVFKELARSWNVEIRWLGVNATKDADHEPRDEFEKTAAKQLKEGKQE